MKAMMRKIWEMHCRCSHYFNTKIASVQQDDKDAKWSSESWKHSHHLHQNQIHRFECLSVLQKCFKCIMWLWLKSSDNETCIHALLELIAFAIKNVTRHWLLELLNNRHYYKEFQSSCKNNDENEAFEAI